MKEKSYLYNVTCKHSSFLDGVYFQCLIPPATKYFEMQFSVCRDCAKKHVDNCTNYHTLSYKDIY